MVPKSIQRILFKFPLWIADTPSAMNKELASKIKVLKEVSSISKTSLMSKKLPPTVAEILRYIRWVEIKVPKNIQSEPRNAHMSTFLFGIPVLVTGS